MICRDSLHVVQILKIYRLHYLLWLQIHKPKNLMLMISGKNLQKDLDLARKGENLCPLLQTPHWTIQITKIWKSNWTGAGLSRLGIVSATTIQDRLAMIFPSVEAQSRWLSKSLHGTEP